MKPSMIAVTGASGMLGRYLCRSLKASGHHVVAVIRNSQYIDSLEKEGFECRLAELNDRDSLSAAFAGCRAVVSNAALYSLTNLNWQDNYRANLEGTENVFEAAAQNDIRRIILISTFGIYRFSPFRLLDENSPLLNGRLRQGGAYRASKQLSEERAWQLAYGGRFELTSLRPSGIYGAGDRNLLPWLKYLMKLPVLVMPKITFPLVYAGDVASACSAALATENSIGQAYNVTGHNLPLVDFLEALKGVTGRGPLILPVGFRAGIEANSSKAARDLNFHNRSYQSGLEEIMTLNSADLI